MKILFAGGGTGGHLFPAIAIAQEVLALKPEAQVAFVGTDKGIEATEVPKYNFTLHLVSAVGFKRGLTVRNLFENLKFPYRVLASIRECETLMWQEEPDVVVGTGGFVSAPAVWAAQNFGIPTLIQEQNSKPGWSTNVLARRANEVHLSFESSKQHFSSGVRKRDGVFVSGNPTRRFELTSKQEARKHFGLDENRKTLFVFGGSLGARSINAAIELWLSEILERFNLIWQTGKLNYESIHKRLSENGLAESKRKNLWYNAFIDRMDLAYSASDLAMCRAGASTIAELGALGIANVLVPFPFAADNHQYFNALALENEKAAKVIIDREIATEKSKEAVLNLLNDEATLIEMRKNVLQFGKPDAAKVIAKRVIKLAQSN